ncbi:hypothetical protein C1H46_001863 [Malus baccata]|uniref:Uncharacterized protein n=1 Tax=Malus baccata TaxID=106549 RepID=A0A540NN58_MALBA|nr:hypothetical protein C1H46_001863 [Malus baccata]
MTVATKCVPCTTSHEVRLMALSCMCLIVRGEVVLPTEVHPGFEGGQMPLYRQLPKLKGTAGGMSVGLPKYVPVNLKDIEAAGFQEGEEVSLKTLKNKGLINPFERERKLSSKCLAEDKSQDDAAD